MPKINFDADKFKPRLVFTMPFGKHKGEEIGDVPAQYLLWLVDEGCSYPEIKNYVSRNRVRLENEAQEERDANSYGPDVGDGYDWFKD